MIFRVSRDATKPQIAKAVEDLFKVKVKAVNTVRTKGKVKALRGKRFHKSDVKKGHRDPGRGLSDRRDDGPVRDELWH